MLNKRELKLVIDQLSVPELLRFVVNIVEAAELNRQNGCSLGHNFTSEELDSLDLIAKELTLRDDLALRHHMAVPLLRRIIQNRRSLLKKEMQNENRQKDTALADNRRH